MRVKRGMTDTGKIGAFCKDQSNFDGIMRILDHRKRIDFPALFAGKVSLETYDLSEKALKMAS